MTSHKFEHPLNEKTRIYLKIEALLRHLHVTSTLTEPLHYLLFFRSIFDLLDIFEQIQLKSELIKDIEKQRLRYKSWQSIDGVDQQMLATILKEVDDIHRNLLSAPRFGQCLKKDRFLNTVRQRFNLPGGSCCFDLPALHYWLHLPQERKIFDINNWLKTFLPLSNALTLWLRLCRETGQFSPQIARAGFFQSDAEEANILRFTIPLEYGVYPMISGHKNRFAIKFFSFETAQAYSKDIEFELAVCN